MARDARPTPKDWDEEVERLAGTDEGESWYQYKTIKSAAERANFLKKKFPDLTIHREGDQIFVSVYKYEITTE